MNVAITVHMIVKNEPFIYYAVKSIYEEADVILLYDTGSDDAHTLQDIELLLKEDKKKKIKFKQTPMDDQTKHSVDNQRQMETEWKGKRGLGALRQQQIEETDTKYFLVVDGDEVHYDGVISQIKEQAIPHLKDSVCCIRIPLVWYCGINEIFNVKNRNVLETTGRVFRADKVYCNTLGFPEEHFVVGTRYRAGKLQSPFCTQVHTITPFCHFEAYLKPWKRPDCLYSRRIISTQLPQVMINNPYYINRYERRLKNK